MPPNPSVLPIGIVVKRTAKAVWSGDLKTGNGVISTESGILKETRYSFASRFESGIGTNPEVLNAKISMDATFET